MLREEFQLEIQPDHLPSRGSYLISNLPFTIDWKLKKKKYSQLDTLTLYNGTAV